jgi:plasmid stabilization system protein ParE
MSFTVIVKEEAHQDIIDAYNYYEGKSTGLGDKFLDSLQRRYSDLSANPSFYSFINEDTLKVLRDVKLEGFPFVIVYEIIELQVIVYAIHNTYKHPLNKLRKI